MFEWLCLLFFAPASMGAADVKTPSEYYVGVVAAEAAYTTLLPRTPDKPAPKPGDICSACKGTGKVGDGTVMKDCKDCKGTGRVLPPQTLPMRELPPPPPPFKLSPVQSVPPATQSSSCPGGQCPADKTRPSSPVPANVPIIPVVPRGLFRRR